MQAAVLRGMGNAKRGWVLAVACGCLVPVGVAAQTVSSAVDRLDPDRPAKQLKRFEEPTPEPRIGLLGDAEYAFALAAIEAGMRAEALRVFEEGQAAPRFRSLPLVDESPTGRRDALGKFLQVGVDGLALRPREDEPAFQSMLEGLTAEQVAFVYLFERGGAAAAQPLQILTASQADLGREAAAAVLENLPDDGPVKVGVLSGNVADMDQASRLVAAVEVLKASERVAEVVLEKSAPDPGSAYEVLQRVVREDLDEEIVAWLFLGNFPLKAGGELPWAPGERLVVAIGASPELVPAMHRGAVDILVAPDFYRWGELAAGTLLGFLDGSIEAPSAGEVPENGPYQRIEQADFEAVLERWGRWLK